MKAIFHKYSKTQQRCNENIYQLCEGIFVFDEKCENTRPDKSASSNSVSKLLSSGQKLNFQEVLKSPQKLSGPAKVDTSFVI